MVHCASRWCRAVVAVAACLAADAAWAKTTHGTTELNLPGIDSMGGLLKELGAPVTVKFSANTRTATLTAHGKGQVTNSSGMAKTFTNALDLGIMGFGLMSLQTTYTVKANGHCTLKMSAILVPPCMEPADSGDECVDDGAGPVSNDRVRRVGAVDAGRRAIPSVKGCLSQQRRIFD